MKKVIRTITAVLAGFCLVCGLLCPAGAETLRECHRVTNTVQTTTQKNKSQVRLWHAETALPEVTDEINGLAEAWAEEIGPNLNSAGNNGKKNSKMSIRANGGNTAFCFSVWLFFLQNRYP